MLHVDMVWKSICIMVSNGWCIDMYDMYDMDSITLFGLVYLSETGHWEYAETSH